MHKHAPSAPLSWPELPDEAAVALAGREHRGWFVAPHVLDLAADGPVPVESPAGRRVRLAPDSQRTTIELLERGFYEARGGSTAIGAGRFIAVNVDLAESDQSHMDPAELVAAITDRGSRGASAAGTAPFTGTAEELERRQAIWWYLLLGALLLLAGETLLSNRLSRRSYEQHAPGVS